jgi:phosphoglucomutase
MKEVEIMAQYQLWLDKSNEEIVRELLDISQDESMIEDAFYRDLTFGTGGLRGIIGAGTNRMNIHTVAKASKGLANYVNMNFPKSQRRIAVSYDSRIKSDLFAKVASGVFAANDIEVFIYTELMPTPCLSYAVRSLKCAAGIMVTASHNPSQYNGYKVYGADGCQITENGAEKISEEIEKLDIFDDVNIMNFDEGRKLGKIHYIPEEIYLAYLEEVKKQSMIIDGLEINKNVSIVYTPFNGTGLKPVLRTLQESGYKDIIVVKEQEQPDGNFPTCPYPNPEIKESMGLAINYARNNNSDLLLATDPDCDRVGIAVKNSVGDYVLLSGNETGMLLLDYICARRKENGTMPEKPVMLKTIVTIDMAERIAASYGVKTINVLTGFKFIGEQIAMMEAQGKEDSFLFGFEESYGYLSGSYVRDKDAVVGVFLICEMFAYYKTIGINLLEKLNELYQIYGFCRNALYSYEFAGPKGFDKMQKIMDAFRNGIISIGSKRVLNCLDYRSGLDGLPKADVLKFLLEDNCSVVVRPSGTEPKLKTYISVSARSEEEAATVEKILIEDLKMYFL